MSIFAADVKQKALAGVFSNGFDKEGTMRLKSHIWVSAYLRRLDKAFIAATMTRRGDASAGAIFIKIAYLDGTAQVFAPISAPMTTPVSIAAAAFAPFFKPATTAFAEEGNSTPIVEEGRAWQAVYPKRAPETDADAYLKRHAARDPDIWILEVESAEGRHMLGELSLAAL